MYRVYGDIQSGNCYKVKLLLSHLEIAHEWVTLEVLKEEIHWSRQGHAEVERSLRGVLRSLLPSAG